MKDVKIEKVGKITLIIFILSVFITSCGLPTKNMSGGNYISLPLNASYDTIHVGYTEGTKFISETELITSDSIVVYEVWYNDDKLGAYSINKTFSSNGVTYLEEWKYKNNLLKKIIYFEKIENNEINGYTFGQRGSKRIK